MDPIIKENEETATREEKKKKRKWGELIMNFMMYGGIFVVAVLIVGIFILVSYLSKR
jgi:methylphosphotriester-DNA--protein-cysteine methyltransferase